VTDDVAAEETTAAPEPETAYGALVTWSRGQRVVHPSRDELVAIVSALRDDGFNQLVDLTAVDYSQYDARRDLPSGIDAERFELVVGLISHARRERIRLRVQVPEADPRVPTLFDLHPGSEALEREVYDMFGIVFEGHPHLVNLYLPDGFQGHPLRKDYPKQKEQPLVPYRDVKP